MGGRRLDNYGLDKRSDRQMSSAGGGFRIRHNHL